MNWIRRMNDDPAGIKRLQKQFLKDLNRAFDRVKTGLAIESMQDSDEHNHREFHRNWLASEILTATLPIVKRYLEIAYKDGWNWFFRGYKSHFKTRLPTIPIDPVKLQQSLDAPRKLFGMKSAIYMYTEKAQRLGYSIEERLFYDESYNNATNRVDEFARKTSQALILSQKIWGATDNAKYNKIEKFSVFYNGRYLTAGDNRVCSKCKADDGLVLSIDELRDLIPQHISCRCWFQIY